MTMSVCCITQILSIGKHVKMQISEKQRIEAAQAFRLMDTDGSGKLDIRELEAAFNLLGLGLDKHQLKLLMNDVDTDRSGMLEIDEFLALMTESINRKADDDMPVYTLPFPLLSSQYKRKRFLAGLISGETSTLNELVGISDKQQKEVLKRNENPKKLELENAAKVIEDKSKNSEDAQQEQEMNEKKAAQSRTALGQAVKRLSQMNKLDEGLVSTLSLDQLRLLLRASANYKDQSPGGAYDLGIFRPPSSRQAMSTPRAGYADKQHMPRPGGVSKPSTPRDLLTQPSPPVPPLHLSGLSQLSPRPNTARSKPSTPRDEQLLDMPQGNLSLFFTRSVIGSRPSSGARSSPRNNSDWLQHHRRTLSSRVQSAVGRGGGSGLSPRSAVKEQAAIDAASHAAGLVSALTPRSARQKGIDYAEMMESEREQYRSSLANHTTRHSPRPLISSGANEALGGIRNSNSRPSLSPRPSSAAVSNLHSSLSSSSKTMPAVPFLQLSKLLIAEREQSPRRTSTSSARKTNHDR